MTVKEKYMSLLDFFDPKKFDHDEVANVIDKVIETVKENIDHHQAACAWIILGLYKRGKCTTLQIDDIISEFNTYMKGLDEYLESIENGDKTELTFTYYNGFLQKKIKGD